MTMPVGASDVEQFSLERAADRLEIMHRVYQFCRAVDRRDVEIARDAFHPDAYDDHGVFKGGVDDLFSWIDKRHADIPFSMHHVGNIFIEFAAADEAMAESYAFVWQSIVPGAALGGTNAEPGGPMLENFGAVRYVDHFTRRDGAWRILKRVTVPEASMTVTLPIGGRPNPGPEWVAPTRDRNDPSQLLRRALGMMPDD